MNILFLVNDFGNGNIVRCKPLIEKLSKEHNVLVFSSKEKLEYLDKGILKFEKKYRYKSFFSPKNILFYIINSFQVARLLIKVKPDRIIIDSDYHILFFSLFYRRNIYSINNSFYVAQNLLKEKLYLSSFLEGFDYLFQKLICYRVIVPVISNYSKQPPGGKFHLFPLWTTIEPCEEKGRDILIIEGGSNLQTKPTEYRELLKGVELRNRKIVIIGLKNTSESNHKSIICRNFVENIQEELNSAGLLVIRGGLSSISDAVGSGLPTIVIPLKGHLEQLVNARLAKKEFGFYMVENIQKLPVVINKYLDGSLIFGTRAKNSGKSMLDICKFLEL